MKKDGRERWINQKSLAVTKELKYSVEMWKWQGEDYGLIREKQLQVRGKDQVETISNRAGEQYGREMEENK